MLAEDEIDVKKVNKHSTSCYTQPLVYIICLDWSFQTQARLSNQFQDNFVVKKQFKISHLHKSFFFIFCLWIFDNGSWNSWIIDVLLKPSDAKKSETSEQNLVSNFFVK